MNDEFKLLFLDIETTPIEALTWGVWQQNVQPVQIVRPTEVLCWAAKWEDSDIIWFGSQQLHGKERMVRDIYNMIDEADAVCHYNGQKFDMKHLNREFLELGLAPPTNYKNIDLLKVVRRHFKFPHNKLEYVAQALGLGAKVQHDGMQLWIDCMNGDKKAWRKMEEYNIRDVELLEEMYSELQGWITGHPNRALWVEDQDNPVCPNCGSHNVIKKGVERPARVNAYQRYKCNDCGANSRGRRVHSKPGDGVLV